MTQNCPVTEEQINALVDGELSGNKQQKIAAHVARCDKCSRLAGELLASKEFVGARMPEVEPPANSWTAITAALDRVDGAIRSMNQPQKKSRWGLVPALAACGLILIAGAFVWRNYYLASNSVARKFATQHLTAVSMTSQHRPASDTSYDVVTPRRTAPAWKPVARWLVRTSGVVADHTLYRLDDRSPVSEFVIPEKLELADFKPAEFEDLQYKVCVRSGVSIVAWRSGGRTRVIAGRIGLRELLRASAARRTSRPAKPGL